MWYEWNICIRKYRQQEVTRNWKIILLLCRILQLNFVENNLPPLHPLFFFPWLAWANNFFHLTFDSISYGGIQKKWIQLLLRLNPRIINCVPFYQSRELRFVFIFPFMIGILSLLQDSENFDLVLIHRLCTDQWLWGLGSKNKPKNYKPIFFLLFFVFSLTCVYSFWVLLVLYRLPCRKHTII